MKAVLPALPKSDANGRFPAIEYTRVSLARSLIRERTALGLTQQQLAKLAGVREETLSRLGSREIDGLDAVIALNTEARALAASIVA